MNEMFDDDDDDVLTKSKILSNKTKDINSRLNNILEDKKKEIIENDKQPIPTKQLKRGFLIDEEEDIPKPVSKQIKRLETFDSFGGKNELEKKVVEKPKPQENKPKFFENENEEILPAKLMPKPEPVVEKPFEKKVTPITQTIPFDLPKVQIDKDKTVSNNQPIIKKHETFDDSIRKSSLQSEWSDVKSEKDDAPKEMDFKSKMSMLQNRFSAQGNTSLGGLTRTGNPFAGNRITFNDESKEPVKTIIKEEVEEIQAKKAVVANKKKPKKKDQTDFTEKKEEFIKKNEILNEFKPLQTDINQEDEIRTSKIENMHTLTNYKEEEDLQTFKKTEEEVSTIKPYQEQVQIIKKDESTPVQKNNKKFIVESSDDEAFVKKKEVVKKEEKPVVKKPKFDDSEDDFDPNLRKKTQNKKIKLNFADD